MWCNSSFKGALGLEIKVRGIVTNFVIYYRIRLQLASRIANLLKRIARAAGADSFEKF
jgi:hypothetical protein